MKNEISFYITALGSTLIFVWGYVFHDIREMRRLYGGLHAQQVVIDTQELYDKQMKDLYDDDSEEVRHVYTEEEKEAHAEAEDEVMGSGTEEEKREWKEAYYEINRQNALNDYGSDCIEAVLEEAELAPVDKEDNYWKEFKEDVLESLTFGIVGNTIRNRDLP